MIRINNKNWNELESADIQLQLNMDDDENFFFEYKSDSVSTKKIVEEISALANTYGGYIFLGVEDNKTISGCINWNEQKIHNVMHNMITPIPNFDIKKFKFGQQIEIFVIKIEEGSFPPYITNTGKIYERVSSGSFPIKESSKLTQLYYKREDNLKKIKQKIEIGKIENDSYMPQNFCGYLDLGFSINCSELLEIQKKFFEADINRISKIIKENNEFYSISRLGFSLLISIGKNEVNSNGKIILSPADMHNFIEIMCDGSIKCRVSLSTDQDTNYACINQMELIVNEFPKIYVAIFGEDFYKTFINAYKYEKLTVLKQFVPYFKTESSLKEKFDKYLKNHITKYGNNLILTSNRIPKSDFLCMDKRYVMINNDEYNNNNLIKELFRTEHMALGFIDNFNEDDLDNK